MGISFHCECCKKRVKAPDGAGGKWGNCPHCDHRCYIPLPPDPDEEELVLAPLDASEETQYEEQMRESSNLTQHILHETVLDDEPVAATTVTEYDEKELIKHIIVYLRQMADGELPEARKTAGKIGRFAPAARNILKKMARAERPEPELADIAPKVLQSLIKKLSAEMK